MLLGVVPADLEEVFSEVVVSFICLVQVVIECLVVLGCLLFQNWKMLRKYACVNCAKMSPHYHKHRTRISGRLVIEYTLKSHKRRFLRCSKDRDDVHSFH